MKTKPKRDAVETQSDAVKFPVLFGIRPRIYVASLYGFVIVAALFFLLIFPGLRRPGCVLVVSSEPRGAAVRVDDVYYESAPGSFFVAKGRHEVSFVLPGFDVYTTEVDAGNRVFGSLFFPKKISVGAVLQETETLAALNAGARDFVSWAFTGEPTEDYQIPLSLSEGAYRSAPKDRKKAQAVIVGALPYMNRRAALKDILRAEFLIMSDGNAPSPVRALDAVREILAYMDRTPAMAVALADVLPDKTAGKLIDSPFYPATWEDNAKTPDFERSGVPFTIEGVTFGQEFRAARYTQSSGYRHIAGVGPFSIAMDEINAAQWRRFLNETPYWRRDNLEKLVEQGLVTEDYLLPVSAYAKPEEFFAEVPAYPAPSMCGISRPAAQAYCAWLTSKLPARLRGYEVRLPVEAEWEYAARFAEEGFSGAPRRMTSRVNRSGTQLEGAGLWEWCADAYAPAAYLPAEGVLLDSPEASVRGGSWVNTPGSVIAETRASLPQDTCSPFLGFRPILAPYAQK